MWYLLDTRLCLQVIRCALHLDSLNIRPAEDDQVVRLLRSSCSSVVVVGWGLYGLEDLGAISKGSDVARFNSTRERVCI